MPSNRRQRRRPLDTEVSQKLEAFEQGFCTYVDKAMPRKFRDTYVKQILHSLALAQLLTYRGLRRDAALFPAVKAGAFEDALAALDCVSTRLNRLNDNGTLSNETKAVLDMQLYDVKDGLERLSSSLRNRAASQVSAGTPVGEAGGLEGCLTNTETDD